MPVRHSSHTIQNGGGSVWGGNPLGGPRDFTIMGSLQPPTIRYGRAPTPKYRIPPSGHTAAVPLSNVNYTVKGEKAKRSL